MAAKKLWVEQYRPSTISEYVFRDDKQRNQITEWIKDGSIPNVLFTGNPGVGKTALAKILINELRVHHLDVIELNASRNNSIDDVRHTITNFVELMPFGDYKVVLLDEVDFFSVNAQAALRGMLEEYHNTARFILTANFPHKIIPAIHSRCQGFHIAKLDEVSYTERVATILFSENVEFDLDTLDTYVKVAYPDLRKCINMLQMNSIDGILIPPDSSDSCVTDFKLEMVELFKKGKINEARQLICSRATAEEMGEIYRWLYDNIELFGSTRKQQDRAVLIIKQGLVEHAIIMDPEINLSATLIKLKMNLEE